MSLSVPESLLTSEELAKIANFRREVADSLDEAIAEGGAVFSSTDDGLAPASGGGTVNFLRADGTWTATCNTGVSGVGTVTTGTAASVYNTVANTSAAGRTFLIGSAGTGDPNAGKFFVHDSTGGGLLLVGNSASITVTPPTTFASSLNANGDLQVDGNTQLGNASTDRVGIGIAPDASYAAMRFAQALGGKIDLYPVTTTSSYGFGIQSNQLQYYVGSSGDKHSFGYGDSDLFVERQRFTGDGQVFFGDAGGGSVENNLDVLTIGNTGTGQTGASKALIRADHSGSFDTTAGANSVFGERLIMSATRSAGANVLLQYGLQVIVSAGQQQNVGVASEISGATVANNIGYYADVSGSAGANYSFYGNSGTLYNAGALQVDGNCTLGNATTDSHTVTGLLALTAAGTNGINVTNTATGQTGSHHGFDAAMGGSYDTTAGGLSPIAVEAVISATRSAGANNLTNTALYGSATGGQVNYGLWVDDGTTRLDGDLDHDGAGVGFYGTAPVAQQTGVAVTAAAIHAALVNLGLITA